MLSKRLLLLTSALALSLGLAVASQAQVAAYPLTGGGLQYQIGGGLPLPIQLTNPTVTGTMFPPLLVPPVGGTATPTGFILQTTARTGMDPRDITIVYPVMSKSASYAKIGVFGQNPALYQVATNLSVRFPGTSQTVQFKKATSLQPTTLGRTGATTTTFTTGGGNKAMYSNALSRRFGGPGRFFVGNPGTKPAGALFTGVNASIWAIAIPGTGTMAGNPPCTHPALIPPFPGGNRSGCVAAMANAVPATGNGGLAVWGGPIFTTIMTPGGSPNATMTYGGTNPLTGKPKKGPEPGIRIAVANSAGLILADAPTAPAPTAMTGFTNMATSFGFPWTTGMIKVSAPAAKGAPEFFTLSGMDSRVSGVGTIQMVSATVSLRPASGPNANRAWLRLDVPEPSVALGTAGALAMLALCHGLARRRSR